MEPREPKVETEIGSEAKNESNDIDAKEDDEVAFDSPQEAIEFYKTELKKSIDALDFERADVCREYIEIFEKQEIEISLDDFYTEFSNKCQNIYMDFVKKRKKLNRKYYRQEIRIRKEFNQRSAEDRIIHLSQLHDFDESQFELYIKQIRTPDNVFEEAIERAKKTALRGNFARAEEMKAAATEAHNALMAKHERDLISVYRSRASAIYEAQEADLKRAASVLNRSIALMNNQRSQEYHTLAANLRSDLKKAYAGSYREFMKKVRAARHIQVEDAQKSFADIYHDILVSARLEEPDPTREREKLLMQQKLQKSPSEKKEQTKAEEPNQPATPKGPESPQRNSEVSKEDLISDESGEASDVDVQTDNQKDDNENDQKNDQVEDDVEVKDEDDDEGLPSNDNLEGDEELPIDGVDKDEDGFETDDDENIIANLLADDSDVSDNEAIAPESTSEEPKVRFNLK